jgi:membrane protein implicated in regulation of membrane protease activity
VVVLQCFSKRFVPPGQADRIRWLRTCQKGVLLMDDFRFWLLVAGVCVGLEFVLPGAILVFVGLAAVVVALALGNSWIHGSVEAITLFFLSGLVSVLGIRSVFLRFFPGDTWVDDSEEDTYAIGARAIVLTDIGPNSPGRIRFQDSTWEAESRFSIKKGDTVIILSRAGNRWVVKPMTEETVTS